jgi:hypothetical protein
LPTTTTPQDTAPLPPAAGASVASPWDRLESDIQTLKQQALATQKSIQQLQAHEAPNVLQTLPAPPGDWDGTVVAVATVLGLSLVLLWWALWVRPQSRLRRADNHAVPDNSNIGRLRRMAQDGTATGHAPLGSTAPTPEDGTGDSLFTRHDPNLGFNSEAAASEVMRVRKSLAEKREARAQQREHEDTTNPTLPQPEAFPLPIDITAAEPVMDLDLDLGLGLEADPEPNPVPSSEPEPVPVPVPVLETVPEPIPAPQPEAPAWPDTDFGITLALAQESESLDLWPEARELATEVLQSQTPGLRDEALALLARLDARDQAAAREAQLPTEPPQGDAST